MMQATGNDPHSTSEKVQTQLSIVALASCCYPKVHRDMTRELGLQ